jgi:exopolyphosphatase/guanosine-5'-triphosphate,3'-diphosphate pyrophosphatase
VRAEEAFVHVLRYPFIGVDHAERAFLAAAISARYAGRPDERWLFPAINLLSPALRRRSLILGRALLLAYRISSGVPRILDDARLRVETDSVRVEVSAAARALDSEIAGDRLRLLASALGARRAEIVVKD